DPVVQLLHLVAEPLRPVRDPAPQLAERDERADPPALDLQELGRFGLVRVALLPVAHGLVRLLVAALQQRRPAVGRLLLLVGSLQSREQLAPTPGPVDQRQYSRDGAAVRG